MWRPRHFLNDWQQGVAIVLGAGLVFFLDITPARAAADGAAYGLVLAFAAYSGRRGILFACGLGMFLTILAPFLGAEGDETLFQILSGRLIGLLVIVLFTLVLLHLFAVSATTQTLHDQAERFQNALSEISRRALLLDNPMSERLAAITELTAGALDADRVRLAQFHASDLRLTDVWDRRLGRHYADTEIPECYFDEVRELMANNFVYAIDDVFKSPIHQKSIDFYVKRNTHAVLHAAAIHREQVIGMLAITHGQPRCWTTPEINFARAVSRLAALVYALHQTEGTLYRLDWVGEGIFVVNADGEITYANRAGRELAGCMDKELPRALPFTLAPLHAENDEQDVFFQGREFEVHRVRLPDTEILIRIEDVTERNAALRDANRMQEQIKESAKLQAMGQMAAGIAHDFNNILAAILAFAQGLARMQSAHPSDVNAMERNLTERILGVCKRGRSLTDEILGFARTASVERSEMDLSELLGSGLDVVPSDGDHPATITVLPPAEPLPVEGNSAQLLQLIQNLAVNAMHACTDDDGHIVISAGRASAEDLRALRAIDGKPHERLLGVIDPSRDYCFLRVADNGHGIPPAVMDRIFEPFFTTKGRHKGSGLGLVVVHGVVDTHNGCCHVRSEPGQGTVFTIYLPLVSEAAIAAA